MFQFVIWSQWKPMDVLGLLANLDLVDYLVVLDLLVNLVVLANLDLVDYLVVLDLLAKQAQRGFPVKIVVFPVKIVVFLVKRVVFLVKIVVFPVKIVVFLVKRVGFLVNRVGFLVIVKFMGEQLPIFSLLEKVFSCCFSFGR